MAGGGMNAGAKVRRTAAVARVARRHRVAANPAPRVRVLAIVAHPDDEYAFAATTYRLTKELGAVVDQIVITNGEGGFRYAALAEAFYGIPLTDEETGRAELPAIRRRETIAAGRILGIRRQDFLDQKDAGFTTDGDAMNGVWDMAFLRGYLRDRLETGNYDYVFTLLPYEGGHGHHVTAARLAVEAAASLPEAQRPMVLAADAGRADEAPRVFEGSAPAFTFSRTARFGFGRALHYGIVVNWAVAEHKSQGLFQTDSGRHDVERFWVLDARRARASERVRRLAALVTPAA